MSNLEEQIRAAEAALSTAVQRVRDLRAQIPKPPPICQTCGRPATWEGYHYGDYKRRYCAEHYHEYVVFSDGELAEWATTIAGEKLVAAEARVAELEATLQAREAAWTLAARDAVYEFCNDDCPPKTECRRANCAMQESGNFSLDVMHECWWEALKFPDPLAAEREKEE